MSKLARGLVGVLVVGTVALPGAVPATATPRANAHSDGSLAVVGRRPGLPAGGRVTGVASAGAAVAGAVALAPRNPADLAALAAAVTNPQSPLYRHYLAPSEFAVRFGPNPSAVAAVAADLRAAGLGVAGQPKDGFLLAFRGRAAQVEDAFHVPLDVVREPGGATALVAAGALRLPAALGTSVLGVVGLDGLHPLQPAGLAFSPAIAHTVTPASVAIAAAPSRDAATTLIPCAAARADAARTAGLTDDRLARAYGLDGLLAAGDAGAGQRIGLIELEGYSRSDVAAFDNCYYGSAGAEVLAHVHDVAVDGGAQNGPGAGEAALDVEDVSALAPGATIDVYEAPNDTIGYLEELARAVADDDPVVSSSWSTGCEALVSRGQPGLVQVENLLFQQAAMQGQTFLAASGDAGSEGCFSTSSSSYGNLVLAVGDPASQPYVLGVGGTTVTAATLPPGQTTWNDASGASGGGISTLWTAPGWQTSSTVPGFANSAVLTQAEAATSGDFCATTTGAPPCREVPDVSADADPDTGGLTVFYGGGWTVIGGTSSAAPQWAAVLADIAANPGCASAPATAPGAGGLGFVPPALYRIASVPSDYAAAFSDVTSGNDDSLSVNEGLYPAATGYDMATGLGTPLVTGPAGAPGLASMLCAAASVPAPAVQTVTPPAVPDATASTVTITGTGFSTTCATVTVGSWVAPPGDVTEDSPTELTVTLPAHATGAASAGTPAGADGAYAVTVGCVGGPTSPAVPASRLDVYLAVGGSATPTVGAVEPSGGPLAGGTTIHIYGTGFADLGAAVGVDIGGLAATDVRVVSDTLLTAAAPPYSPGRTACAPGDGAPAVDVCQTEVQVVAGGVQSSVSPLTRELHGLVSDVASTAPGYAPAPTEYDYLPTPALTSVHVNAPSQYASEMGGTAVTVHGVGLGILGLEWFDVGPPGAASAADISFVSDTATAVKFLLPDAPRTGVPLSWAVAAQTLASPSRLLDSPAEPSRSVSVLYAPTPSVARILTGGHRQVGPTRGGTPLVVVGHGFYGQPYVEFADVHGGPSVAFDYAARGVRGHLHGELSLRTPTARRGVDVVAACNVSGCSLQQGARTLFTFYPPGVPGVGAVSPRQAPAGRTVVITGRHLGYVQRVLFGRRAAKRFSNPIDSHGVVSESRIDVVVPPGIRGEVDVRVVTAESLDAPHPASAVVPADRFR